jgi:Domain of unknown function (DUF1937)
MSVANSSVSYIYLATPYSINAPANTIEGSMLREKRYQEAVSHTVEMSKKGEVIFSPIVHSHPLAVHGGLPGTWDFWSNIDYVFIDNCEKVRVVKMDMWDKSVGITAEIAYAKKIGKEVEYIDVPTNQS